MYVCMCMYIYIYIICINPIPKYLIPQVSAEMTRSQTNPGLVYPQQQSAFWPRFRQCLEPKAVHQR